MKGKVIIPILLFVLLLAACGQGKLDEPIALVNQHNEEVVFPTGEPAVFFFITSYT
ncbi:hypothetical protein [Bacillus sp. B15-48]|uniref:hypothetical protein n=1 Tax=Bacillus sp. B15-48 TaxID=1548601 RepID=UPI00193FD0F1|nr:hypothetical protein [Bacillus sp. B15-48]MBM4760675.1 hypothetical protein [Bacillus sp. B15-48]